MARRCGPLALLAGSKEPEIHRNKTPILSPEVSKEACNLLNFSHKHEIYSKLLTPAQCLSVSCRLHGNGQLEAFSNHYEYTNTPP